MNKNLTKKEKILIISRFCIFAVVVGLMIWATFALLPIVGKLADETTRLEFKAEMAQKGLLGVVTVIGLQILQIVIAVIPGQPMEIVAGMLYGTIGGVIVCTIGIFIGTTIVYFLVRKIGSDFIQLFFSKDKIEQIQNKRLFKNPKNLELLLFIIFIIPAIPKDIFIYIGGLSPIKPKRFLLIATLARIPGLFVTVYAGNKLSDGNFVLVAIMIAIFILIGIIGYYIGNKAQDKLEQKS